MSMIKKLLLISALFVSSVVARAQYVTVVTEKNNSCTSAVLSQEKVRHWTGTKYAVTFAHPSSDSSGVFRLIDFGDYTTGAAVPQFPVYEVPLPDSVWTIIDFRIIGDILCFCGCGYYGTDISQIDYAGYVGFFKMTDLLSGGPVNYQLVKYANAGFERIEGFCDNYGFKVFALGFYKELVFGNSYHTYYAIVEVDSPFIGTTITAKRFMNPLQQPNHEFFDDIVVLEDRVVFTCAHLNTALPPYIPLPCWGPIVMRWVKKSSGISDPNLDYRHYQTSTMPMPEEELNSRIMAKPIDKDKFVIAYTNSDYPTGQSTRRIRVFDSNLDNLVSQEFSIFSKMEMYEMAYNQDMKTLTVLEPTANSSRFVFVHPENTAPYTALTLSDPDEEYLSLDTITSKQFVSTQHSRFLFQHADLLSSNPSATSNGCLDNNLEEVAIIGNLVKNDYMDTLLPFPSPVPFFDTKPVITCNVKKECISD